MKRSVKSVYSHSFYYTSDKSMVFNELENVHLNFLTSGLEVQQDENVSVKHNIVVLSKQYTNDGRAFLFYFLMIIKDLFSLKEKTTRKNLFFLRNQILKPMYFDWDGGFIYVRSCIMCLLFSCLYF